MKIALLSALLLGIAHTSIAAEKIPLDSVEFNENGEFVSCKLSDGRDLVATRWLVILGKEILVKGDPIAEQTHTADYLVYESSRYKVTVGKQFCGREGYMAAEIISKHNSKSESVQCVSRNRCE